MVARIGLGVFEAGFGPGIPVYFVSKLKFRFRAGIYYGQGMFWKAPHLREADYSTSALLYEERNGFEDGLLVWFRRCRWCIWWIDW